MTLQTFTQTQTLFANLSNLSALIFFFNLTFFNFNLISFSANSAVLLLLRGQRDLEFVDLIKRLDLVNWILTFDLFLIIIVFTLQIV